MYCPNCGREVGDGDRFCSSCSFRLTDYQPVGYNPTYGTTRDEMYVRTDTKSTGLALFMSLILPGLGALYVDSDVRGLIVFVVSLISAGVFLYLGAFIGGVAMLVLWIYGIVITSHAIDSYKVKNNIR